MRLIEDLDFSFSVGYILRSLKGNHKNFWIMKYVILIDGYTLNPGDFELGEN